MTVEDIGAFDAKTRLSELLQRVERGQVYRITRRGRPIAELRPVAQTQRRPTFGANRGRIAWKGDFDAPLPEFTKYTR